MMNTQLFLKRTIHSLLAILLLSIGSHSYPENKQTNGSIDRLIAIVNNEVVTERELSQQIKTFLAHLEETGQPTPSPSTVRTQVLDHIILEKIQLQIAKKNNIVVDDANVQEEMNYIAEQNQLTTEEFEKLLSEKHIPINQFRQNLKNTLSIRRLQQQELASNITVSENEIKSFLNTTQTEEDKDPIVYQVGYVLLELPEKPQAEDIKSLKQQAKDISLKVQNENKHFFESNSYSSGKENIKTGILNWRTIAELPTAFSKEVPQLMVNGMQGPIQTDSGFYIIKLLGKRKRTTNQATEIHIRHILLKLKEDRTDFELEEKLNTLRQKVLQGSDFSELARLNSEETKTVAKGGDLGWINEKMVLPEFYQQIQSLEVNDVSAPFKTELGWHLVQVLNKRLAKESPDLKRKGAVEALKTKKFEAALKNWLKQIREDSQVIIYPTHHTTHDADNAF